MANICLTRRDVVIAGAITPLAGSALANVPSNAILDPLSPLYRKDIPAIVQANYGPSMIAAGKFFAKYSPVAKKVIENVGYGVLSNYFFKFLESLGRSEKDRLIDAADEAGVIRDLALRAASAEKDSSVIIDALKTRKKIWVASAGGAFNPNAVDVHFKNTSQRSVEGWITLGLRDTVTEKDDPQQIGTPIKAEASASGSFVLSWPYAQVAHGPKRLVLLDAPAEVAITSSEVHVAGIMLA